MTDKNVIIPNHEYYEMVAKAIVKELNGKIERLEKENKKLRVEIDFLRHRYIFKL